MDPTEFISEFSKPDRPDWMNGCALNRMYEYGHFIYALTDHIYMNFLDVVDVQENYIVGTLLQVIHQ